MTAVPLLIPVTVPVASPTVAFVVFPLIHVPPDEVFESAAPEPTHTVSSPVIAGGAAVMVTIVVRTHELDNVYVIVVVPVVTGDTTPADEMLATVGVLLDHEPPIGVEERVVEPAGHNGNVPLIIAGRLLTVTSAVDLQPVARV